MLRELIKGRKGQVSILGCIIPWFWNFVSGRCVALGAQFQFLSHMKVNLAFSGQDKTEDFLSMTFPSQVNNKKDVQHTMILYILYNDYTKIGKIL